MKTANKFPWITFTIFTIIVCIFAFFIPTANAGFFWSGGLAIYVNYWLQGLT